MLRYQALAAAAEAVPRRANASTIAATSSTCVSIGQHRSTPARIMAIRSGRPPSDSKATTTAAGTLVRVVRTRPDSVPATPHRATASGGCMASSRASACWPSHQSTIQPACRQPASSWTRASIITLLNANNMRPAQESSGME
ncbi:Uncharacterised protein [Bordetella pertussis]|nr:Uncharacterised protein [Bordetella pertussis]